MLLQSVRRARLEDRADQVAAVTPQPSWLDGVDELLDTLPADQRSAVELRVLEDLSYGRVAARLSITPENARMRVHRALGALRHHPSLTTGMTGEPR